MIIRTESDVTEAVLQELARAESPRFRDIMACAVRHLHAFAREAKLSEAEFHQACGVIARLGQLTTPSHKPGR
nr:truncated MnbC' [Comamonas sp. JS46]